MENFLPTSLTLHGRGAGAGGRRCSGTRKAELPCFSCSHSYLVPCVACCALFSSVKVHVSFFAPFHPLPLVPLSSLHPSCDLPRLPRLLSQSGTTPPPPPSLSCQCHHCRRYMSPLCATIIITTTISSSFLTPPHTPPPPHCDCQCPLPPIVPAHYPPTLFLTNHSH